MLREHDGPSMALLVRTDLNLSSGKVAVQCAHAAGNCALIARKSEPRIMERWQANGARKICLAIEDVSEIKSIMAKAKSAGLIAYLGSHMEELPWLAIQPLAAASSALKLALLLV